MKISHRLWHSDCHLCSFLSTVMHNQMLKFHLLTFGFNF